MEFLKAVIYILLINNTLLFLDRARTQSEIMKIKNKQFVSILHNTILIKDKLPSVSFYKIILFF